MIDVLYPILDCIR